MLAEITADRKRLVLFEEGHPEKIVKQYRILGFRDADEGFWFLFADEGEDPMKVMAAKGAWDDEGNLASISWNIHADMWHWLHEWFDELKRSDG